MDRVAVGHRVAQEAGAEGSRAFGPLAPDWDSWTAPKGLTGQWAGGTSQEEQAPCLEQAEHWLRGDVQIHPGGKSRLSKPPQKGRMVFPKAVKLRGEQTPSREKALRNPRKVLHAKDGVSGEPCEAGWLKAQSPWDGSQGAESQSSAGTCRSRPPWQNWPGKFVLLAVLRIKKALRPPALSFLCTNKDTPTTIKLQNPFH